MSTITPIKPTDAGGPDYRDKATGGYDLRSLERLVRSCDEQPNAWRLRADICHAYFDGKQLTAEQEAFIAKEGLEPRSTNLIGRVVRSVTGQEARNRSDIRIEADSGELGEVLDVLNVAMKEAQRESYADMAVSAAYSGQVIGGIGWVEVSRDRDPLNYPYRVGNIHRSEMHWDFCDKNDLLLRKARWMVRSEWHDLDELEQTMPKHRAVLRMMANGWEGWTANALVEDVEQGQNDTLQRAFDDFRRFNVRSFEWLDTMRKRVRLYEVWYKVPAQAVVMRMGPTRVILFDPANRLHQVAVERGLVKIEKVLTRQVRKAIFAGPYRLMDVGTTKRNFPYVPFFAFRDDADGSPYGLVDGMISPQDEYNDRRLRIQWMLRARQILVDNDALDSKYNNLEDLADEAMRPDMVLVLNAARRNANGVQILSNLSLQKEQVEVMNDARNLIQDVPGVYGSQMGMAQGGVTANSAMQTLVEQGMVSMGDLNDNYRNSRRLVYENLLDLIVEDHSEAELKVMVGEGQSRRVVVLNTFDKAGMPVNMVKDAPTRVGMSDIPSSPAARAQQATMLSEVIKSIGNMPQAVAVLIPPLLENSALDSETRKQAVQDFRKVMGMPPGGDKAAREQMDAQAAEQAAQQAAAAQEAQQAQLDEQKAKVAKLLGEVDLLAAKVAEINAGIEAQAQGIDDALNEADQAITTKPA
jgi:hypothetical protein